MDDTQRGAGTVPYEPWARGGGAAANAASLTPVSRQTAHDDAATELNGALSGLEQQVMALIDRLRPVVQGDPAGGTRPPDPVISSVAVLGELQRATYRVLMLGALLAQTADQLVI